LLVLSGITGHAFAQTSLSALREPIEARIAPHRGVVGVGLIDLRTGDSLSIRGNESFPTASVIKLAVLTEVFHQVYNGKLRLEDPIVLLEADKKPGSGILQFFSTPHQMTVADAALLMVAHSDNTASNLLIDKVGIRAVGTRMDSLGLPRTTLHSRLFDRPSSIAPDSSTRYGVGVSTPLEMTRLLALMYQGKLVSPEASTKMIDMMKRQFYREMIPRQLAGVTIANKTGSVNASRIDCGIVYGGESRDYALCVFTNDNQDQSWRLDNEAQVLIGDIARIVHNALAPRVAR
jgi:beta-lactamase class A